MRTRAACYTTCKPQIVNTCGIIPQLVTAIKILLKLLLLCNILKVCKYYIQIITFFFNVSMFLSCSMKVRTNFTIIHEVHIEHLKSSGKKSVITKYLDKSFT